MAKDESEFQKLLSEAPMAPNADTVTVVGMLSRTADPSRFVLTLPEGRTVTLEVDMVKSAKTVAGVVGQSLVQIELDSKRLPESVAQSLFKSGPDYTGVYADYHFGPWGGTNGGLGGGQPGSTPTNDTRIEVAGNPTTGLAPFVAEFWHQANPATIAALTQAQPGTPHYLSHIFKSIPQMDVPHPPKQPIQDGTNPWNSFDITGGGAFDVITYNQGNPTYHY